MSRVWEPSPDEVKAQLPARIGGGPFTDTTVPSWENVAILCSQAAVQVEIELGAILPALYERAQHVATILAAYWVERRLFPEQQVGDGGPANALWIEYLRLLAALKVEVDAAAAAVSPPRLGTLKTPSAATVAAQTLYPGLRDCW